MKDCLDLIYTTPPFLANVKTSLPRSQRQNSVQLNTEPVILNTSSQPASTNNQILHLTPQQLVNFVRKLNSKNIQQTTNAPSAYHLQAASTQTPSQVFRRNEKMVYP